MEILRPLTNIAHVIAPIDVPASRFQVRLAKSHELEAVFQLRYRVFFDELGASNPDLAAARLDIDKYDAHCDHLVVTDNDTIVGTYRLLPLRRLVENKIDLGCYSQSEFDVTSLRECYDDSMLELGRTCVEPAYRNGMIAALLWSGITRYFRNTHIAALFGCVSIHGVSHDEAQAIALYFREAGVWDSRFELPVHAAYKTPASSRKALCPKEAKTVIPSLLNGYLTMGAKICGGPAYDAEFHCHDFLIVLDAKNISEKRLQFLERMAQRTTNLEQ